MMETSVLMQSQELKRTKRLFLRDKERLEVQLATALDEVEGRDKIIKDRDKDAEAKLKALLDMEVSARTKPRRHSTRQYNSILTPHSPPRTCRTT